MGIVSEDVSIASEYERLKELEIRVEQLQKNRVLAEKELAETKKRVIEKIRSGEGSGNRFRDFVFVKLQGQRDLPLENWLKNLDDLVYNHPGHLALVIEDEPYDRGPRGGVIFEHHTTAMPEPKPEPVKRRALKLAVINGGLLLNPTKTAYAKLPCAESIERISLLTWNEQETESFALEKKTGPCTINFGDRVTGHLTYEYIGKALGKLKKPVVVLPFVTPEVIIGDQAVTEWMLKHRLHRESGGIPSVFYGMCQMLGYRLRNEN